MKVFDYVEDKKRSTETLRFCECSQGVYIAINRLPKFGALDGDEEHTSSIIVPFSEVPELMNQLSLMIGRISNES